MKEFKEGDKVVFVGVEGVVAGIYPDRTYPVRVEFYDCTHVSFTFDGKNFVDDIHPSLFHVDMED